MMPFTDMTGLAGCAFAAAVLAVQLPPAARLPRRALLLLVCGGVALALLPFGGLSLAAFLRGLFGEPSIPALVLLALALRENAGIRDPQRDGLLVFIAIAALALYPFALGVGLFDPYRLGYGNIWFIVGLFAVALLAWVGKYALVVSGISLAVLAWAFGWYESNNLWNYLLDPWVSFYALGVMIKRGVPLLRRIKR